MRTVAAVRVLICFRARARIAFFGVAAVWRCMLTGRIHCGILIAFLCARITNSILMKVGRFLVRLVRELVPAMTATTTVFICAYS